jgi:hypothetical protein
MIKHGELIASSVSVTSSADRNDKPLTSLASPRFECSPFSLLAELLPERISPELLFLETKWASLMSYG